VPQMGIYTSSAREVPVGVVQDACQGCAVPQVLIAVFGFAYFARADWEKLARIVSERANSDRLGMEELVRSTGGTSDQLAPSTKAR
jgi:hypothetical protein